MLSGAVILLFLLPATVACLHYAAGAILGRFPRRTIPRTPTHRIAILIPAHDEEAALPQALASLAAADYPSRLLSVWVVADHCTDGTAKQAQLGGASCLVRRGSLLLGKGHALAFGLAEILPTRPDAVLIFDADCGISPGLLKRFDAELAAGAKAVQAPVISLCDAGDPVSIVAAIGAAFDNRMAVAGDRLGRSATLRGTGMLFAREILERHPWTQFGLAEDAEYGARLRRHGVPIRFAAGEAVTCEAPPGTGAFLGQRRRWGASLRVPDGSFAGRAFASKPVILVHLLMTVALVIFAPMGDWSRIWAALIAALTAAVYADAMLGVGVRWPGLRSVWIVGRLAFVALGSLRSSEVRWQRTPR